MSFLHPWALTLGGLALGLPILVHWLTRPRPRRLPLSTLRFVREVVHQRRAVHRLRDFIILGLRALAVAMLAWAFSRPLLGDRRLTAQAESANAARVILLDVSQSMAAVSRGVQTFDRARSAAAAQLDGASGLQADIIFAGAQPRRAFDGLSANLAELRRELASAQPRCERCDVPKALLAAADILGKAPSDKDHSRELVIISDLQQANWKAADFSVLPADTVIHVESVAPERVPANLAIVRVTAGGRAELGRQTRIEVEVANHSETPRNVTVDLTLGPAVHRLEGVCAPGATLVLSKAVPLQGAGWQQGMAKLIGVEDAIAADNARPFVLEVRTRPTYGLITREEASRRPSASYYLERVLAPNGSRERRPRGADSDVAGSTEKVVRIPPGQVNREMLAPVDLLVIARPGKFAADAVNLITAMMRRGKPVVYAAAEAVDATNLKLLVDAAGPDLHMPVEFSPASNRRACRSLALAEYRRELPPFSVFGPQVVTAIEPLRFTRGLDSRSIAGGLKDDVVASYADKTAGLVWASCGAGALVVLNADLAESNLPQSAAFVPIMGELVGNLLDRRRVAQATDCGEPITAYLPAEAGSVANLKLRGPAGISAANELGELIEEPAGVVWRWRAAAAPGVYEVARDGKTVLAVATGVPGEESDLRPMSANEITAHAAGGRTVHYRSATSTQRDQDDLWTWIGVACVVCMLVELVALRAFRT